MEPITFRFDDWGTASTLLESLASACIFRGQSKSTWPLASSLERLIKGRGIRLDRAEAYLLHQFKRHAHRYLGSHLPAHDIEWLALMQHHGTPTRLLDWTESPYVAAYFAFEGANENEGYVAIWAFEKRAIELVNMIRWQETFEDDFGDFPGFASPEYADVILREKIPGVYVVQPYPLNERLALQHGLFLLPGDPLLPFSENLKITAETAQEQKIERKGFADIFYKIEISARQKKRVLRALRQMNISRATLFPGLDGLAQSLKYELMIRSEIEIEHELKALGHFDDDSY